MLDSFYETETVSSPGGVWWFSDSLILSFCSLFPCKQNHEDNQWDIFSHDISAHIHLQNDLAEQTAETVTWRQTDVWVHMAADMMRCAVGLLSCSDFVFTFSLWSRTTKKGKKKRLFIYSLLQFFIVQIYLLAQKVCNKQNKTEWNTIRKELKNSSHCQL